MRVVFVALLGFSGGCTGTEAPPSVVLDGEERLEVHELGPLPAPGVLADGERVQVEWMSSTPGVVTVEDSSIVAVGEGESHLTARVGEQVVEWVVVVDLPAAVRFSNAPTRLMVGETVALEVEMDGEAEHTDWESSNPDIAMVEPDGRLTGVSPGRVYITASAGPSAAMVEIDVVP